MQWNLPPGRVIAPSRSCGAVSVRLAFKESGCLGVQPKAGGKFLLKLNIGERPIANKYREGKMKRTLKRELKVPEIVERKPFATCVDAPLRSEPPVVSHCRGVPVHIGSRAGTWHARRYPRLRRWGYSSRAASARGPRSQARRHCAALRGLAVLAMWTRSS